MITRPTSVLVVGATGSIGRHVVEESIREGYPICSLSRCLRNLGSMKDAVCLGTRYGADTPRSAHWFPDSRGIPNRASESGTSMVWPRANCAPGSEELGSSRKSPSQHR
jgi:NmrA-like family